MIDKKELTPYREKSGIYKVMFVGGGELPVELSGGYTKKAWALKAIGTYLDKRDAPKRNYVKAGPNGKVETQTSRSK